MENKTNKKIKKINEGFSLMETLIWVGIVGIFTGLVGISGMNFWNSSRVKGAMQEMKVYSAGLLQYYDTEGKYPSNQEGLKVLIEKNIVQKKNTLDPWNNEYIYTVNDEANGFSIKSLGSDKKEGGDGTKKDLEVSENMENGKTEDSAPVE